MINLIQGQINIGEAIIKVTSRSEELDVLADRGLIEKRENPGDLRYHLESEADRLRFAVSISVRDDRIEWLLLRWLDSPMKSWDDVTKQLVTDEYRLLSSFVKRQVGARADSKRFRTRTWHVKWGKIDVNCNEHEFSVSICMMPK